MSDTNKNIDLKQLAQTFVNLTVAELNQLNKILEEEHGIKPEVAAAPMMMASGPAEAEQKVEKTNFDIMLQSAGSSKLKVIQAIRKFTDLGVKEAKELVDNLPAAVKENVKKEEAECADIIRYEFEVPLNDINETFNTFKYDWLLRMSHKST